MNKIVIAITGASGSIYAKLLLNKLLYVKDQWEELSVVMTDNACEVWKTELGDEEYKKLPVKFYSAKDFFGTFCIGFGFIQYYDYCSMQYGYDG